MTDKSQSLAAAAVADEWGVQVDWVDANDRPHRAAQETVALMRAVIGSPPADLELIAPVVTRPGRHIGLGQCRVTCEDGTTLSVGDELPEDFPLGYHRIRTPDGHDRRLIVSPGRCWLPDHRVWGWTAQLYAARSRTSGGIGDLADLCTLREWTQRLGGGFLLVNPLHAVAPTLPQEASPYLPATRRFRNPVYLRIEDVPGVEPFLAAWEQRRTPLNTTALLDRDAVWTAKLDVLREVFDATDAALGGEFATWREARGATLQEFATWSVLTGLHGSDWHDWPRELHRPGGPAVTEVAETRAADIAFHAWLQWLLDGQMRAATGDLTVIQDLPIGVSGGGADAWAWQDVMAEGMSVGAPPDLLNAAGQDWGSPPMAPWRLRAADYEPFIESVRGTIAGAGGLRIDHVMGLFRLWWVPREGSPTEGAYVRYPSDDLLDIVALESHRAAAVVVGEDLGTVEPGVREELAERNILSYRLLWFEEEEPAEWPIQSLAAVTTHDLPTVAGLWTGSDAADQQASTGMSEADVASGRQDLLARLNRSGTLSPSATPAEAVQAAYTSLAEAPSVLVSLSLEDAVHEERRPNVPGTVERENWMIPLRMPLEEVVASTRATELATLMHKRMES